jgi:hypothetical protein
LVVNEETEKFVAKSELRVKSSPKSILVLFERRVKVSL